MSRQQITVLYEAQSQKNDATLTTEVNTDMLSLSTIIFHIMDKKLINLYP